MDAVLRVAAERARRSVEEYIWVKDSEPAPMELVQGSRNPFFG